MIAEELRRTLIYQFLINFIGLVHRLILQLRGSFARRTYYVGFGQDSIDYVRTERTTYTLHKPRVSCQHLVGYHTHTITIGDLLFVFFFSEPFCLIVMMV